MLNVRWFDTITSTWGRDNATVSDPQQNIVPRAFHSATLLPGSTKILIYGGSAYIASQNTIPADYAYLYDYESKQYNLLDLGSNGAGRRSGHCAVLYKHYIFFMFGFNDKLQLQNDVNVLDVSNVTQPVWVMAGSSNNGTMPPSGSGLSAGATAGIAVAAVIVGLGIAFAGVFIWCRRRKHDRERDLNQLDPRATLNDFHAPIYSQNPVGTISSDLGSPSAQDDRTHSSTPYYLKEIIKPSSDEPDPCSKPFAHE
ncbi:hypothetical protein BCR42DRAFT_58491 [Absidia repens]|uniref:Uncharacterized protein n=1 Tax=Absidia repens TaxID=90262 RepID=A0A1X2IE80_9FUNG|nr:hypothetical protein BCR42DRAFT_58491 [Absidia repens]